MKKQSESITYNEALIKYFGGLSLLSKQPLPFKCFSCGKNYTIIDEGIKESIMSLSDIFVHIRKTHKEKLRKSITKAKIIQKFI